MTQQRWLILRNMEEIPMDVWFNYYIESGGLVNDFNQFVEFFSFLLMNPVVIGSGKVIAISLSSATHRIHNYYNNKFGL